MPARRRPHQDRSCSVVRKVRTAELDPLDDEGRALTRSMQPATLRGDMALGGAWIRRSRHSLVRASLTFVTLVTFIVALAVQGGSYLWCNAMQRPMASSCCPAAARSDADAQNHEGASLDTRCCEQRLRDTLGAVDGTRKSAPSVRAPLATALGAVRETGPVPRLPPLDMRWVPRGGLSPPTVSKRLALLSVLHL